MSRRTVRDDTFNSFTKQTNDDLDELFKRLKALDRKFATIDGRLGDVNLKSDDARDRQKRDINRIYGDLEMLRNAIAGQLPEGQALALPALKQKDSGTNIDPSALQELQQTVVQNTDHLDKHRRRLRELTQDHNRHIGILKGKVRDLDAKLRALAELTQTITGDNVSVSRVCIATINRARSQARC